MKAVTCADWNWRRGVVAVRRTLVAEMYACLMVLAEELALELMSLLPETVAKLCCYCKFEFKV